MTDKERKEKVEKVEEIPLTEEEKAQIFYNKYLELCQEYGFNLATLPSFVSRDDGTFSIVLNTKVNRLPTN